MSAAATTDRRRKRLSHEERRHLIIETTLACLARHGAEGTTLRSVCREMGVAPSLVTHFFTGWNELLAAAYEAMSDRFTAQLVPLSDQHFPTQRARMDELIRRYLRTDWVGQNTIGANIALWQLSRSVIDLKPVFKRSAEERKQILGRALALLAEEAGATIDVDEMTLCLILMLDGVWLELSLNPGNIVEDRARQMCWLWIDTVLGRRPGALGLDQAGA